MFRCYKTKFKENYTFNYLNMGKTTNYIYSLLAQIKVHESRYLFNNSFQKLVNSTGLEYSHR